MGKTRYYVLKQTGEGGTWENYVENIEATSAKSAIRAALAGNGQGGIFVAVPKRSWNPQPVKVETQQRLKIG